VWGDTGEAVYERGKSFRTMGHSILLTRSESVEGGWVMRQEERMS